MPQSLHAGKRAGWGAGSLREAAAELDAQAAEIGALKGHGRDVGITVDLSPVEAMALAQLCKRFGFDHAISLSNPHDQGAERDQMLQAITRLGRALEERGFAPR